MDGEPSSLAKLPDLFPWWSNRKVDLRVFALQLAKHEIFFGIRLPLGPCFLPGVRVCGFRASHPSRADRFSHAFRFGQGQGSQETVSGNTFVATLPGVHPVFGEALTIRVRGLQAESIREKDPQKAALAFDQRLAFRRAMDNARRVELKNLERGKGGFWIWADLYLDGQLIQ